MSNIILSVVAVIMALLIIAQIAKLNDLGKMLRGKDETGDRSNNDNKTTAMIFMGFALFFLALIYYTHYEFKPKLLPRSASVHGVWLDEMFDVTGYLTGFVFVVTHLLMFYFIYKYKGRADKKGYFYPVNHKLEIWWTVIPSIFLVGLVFMGMKNWYRITGDAPKGSAVVEVTGEQFKWNVRYPGPDATLGQRYFDKIGTDEGKNILGVDWKSVGAKDDFMTDEIHIVVNQPVKFKLGSKDVIHSFFLPHFRAQQNCVPGMPTEFHLTPTITTDEIRKERNDATYDYYLACAAICGASHYNMKMKIIVDTQEEYNIWAKEQKSYYYTTVNPSEAPMVDSNKSAVKMDTTKVVASTIK